MTRFLISDHHFDHDNIREYCNRPFDSVDEMNRVLQNRWKEAVGPDDVVFHGGDFVMGSGERAGELLNELPGAKLLIEGNHDRFSPERVSVPVVEDTIIQHDGFRFWYTHRPENVPDYWTEWVLHGHTHNDDPFINYSANLVNISVEVVGYTPIPLPQVTKALSVMSNGEIAETVHESPIKHHQWYQETTTKK